VPKILWKFLQGNGFPDDDFIKPKVSQNQAQTEQFRQEFEKSKIGTRGVTICFK